MFSPRVSAILSVYLRATPDMLTAGLSWYDDANAFARTLDSTRWHRAAGVIAALSPMNGWENNKVKAGQLYAQHGMGEGCGLYQNVAKAQRIYHGEDALDVLGGSKVRAFYCTIVDPHNPEATPVIDRHAFDIAVGAVTDDRARATLGRRGEYERYADAYREAAIIASIGAPQIQAVTWMQWRREKGIG